MDDKASKQGAALVKRMTAAQVDLKKAVKDYFSFIQKEVDKTTEFLTNYVQEDVTALRTHRLEAYKQLLTVVIVPAADISANDIAPKYATKVALKFHLFAFVRDDEDAKPFWISGSCMLAQGAECPAVSNLEKRLKELSACGISVSLAEPKKKRRKLIEQLIEKHNMIERHVVSLPSKMR